MSQKIYKMPTFLFTLAFTLLLAVPAGMAEMPPVASPGSAADSLMQDANPAAIPWRIRLHEAAVIPGDMVLLGDIGQVFGTPPPGVWEQLAARPLWPAPPDPGKALQISRNKLEQALRQTLGNVADLCVLPKSMALQRGGAVLREDDLRALVVKELTAELRNLDGEGELLDFRLPAYAFLSHDGQTLTLDPPLLAPGRVSLRFLVKEVDGRVLRRFTGTMMLNLWKQVPSPAKPVNRGEELSLDNITWLRMNMAYVRGDLWDGRGGPWQVQRAIAPDQPIYRNDLIPLWAIKKGTVVNLIYMRGNVQLATKAEALTDGGLGDSITVRNLQSEKQVFAIVQSADTVVVK